MCRSVNGTRREYLHCAHAALRRQRNRRFCSYGAAKESNLPTRGLHGPAGFEDRMGHQTPAAPLRIIR
jgi:hypothetical protein